MASPGLWERLTRPHPSLQSIEQRRQSRLLASMLIFMFVIGAAIVAFLMYIDKVSFPNAEAYVLVSATSSIPFIYLVNRYGHYRSAASLTMVILMGVFLFGPFSEDSAPDLMYYIVVPILMSSIFFAPRITWGLVIFSISIMTAAVVLLPDIDWRFIYLPPFTAFASAIVLSFVNYRNGLEQERQAELRAANTALRESEASLERRVTARTRDLQIAADVSKQITTVLDVDDLLPQLVKRTRQGFELHHVSVFLFDKETETLRREASTSMVPVQTVALANRGLAAQAAREHQPVLVNDVEQNDSYAPNVPGTRAELALPMLVGDRLIGVLDLQATEVNRFSQDDVRVLTNLAEQIAVAVRNAQLYTEAEAARELAEEANRTKSQFLANMSHELRTPLNAILNFTAFVADGVYGPVNEDQVEALQETIGSGKHLLSLINDVLDLTKIEAGLMDLFIEEVDLNETLAVIESVAKGLVKDKSIRLTTDIAEELPHTYGDKRRLRQVFLNLISNAVKFTPEGEVSITASRENGSIHVNVRDTGIGIAPEDHALVFESFKQAKHNLHESVGTGLGMPISKYFVESHGGEMWFESEVGAGTIFHVVLPIQTEAEALTRNAEDA